jgi:hypothetical protein
VTEVGVPKRNQRSTSDVQPRVGTACNTVLAGRHETNTYRISLHLGACAYMRKHAYFPDFRKSNLARLLAHAPIFEYRRTSHIASEMASEMAESYDYGKNSAVEVLQSAVHVCKIDIHE